jgi:hypothetical protein
VLGATLLVAGGRVKIPKTFGWEDKRKFGLCRSRALGEEEDGNAEDFFFRMECRKLQPARLTKVEYTTGVRMVFSCALAPKFSKL